MYIAPFKIEEWMNEYETSAIYDLTTTCIKPLTLSELLKFESKETSSIFDVPLGYGDITGSKKLKEAILTLYETQRTENITVTHGAIGANQLVFLSLLEQGDEVVSIVPTYQQHYSIPKSLGANVRLLFLKEENKWLPDLEELENILSKKTKLLCLNNPNNPTGSVIPDDILKQIVDIAEKNNTWILSDEVYRGLNLFNNPYSKSVADIYSKGISVGSMSKTYSLPGLRVGWICAEKDLIKEINHQRQYNTISISALDDFYAAIALDNHTKIEERNYKIAREGLNILKTWAENEPMVECVYPRGGTTALVKYLINIPSKDLCKDLQQKTGLALLPGETLEMEGYVRIGFCAEKLEQSLRIFSDYLNNLV